MRLKEIQDACNFSNVDISRVLEISTQTWINWRNDPNGIGQMSISNAFKLSLVGINVMGKTIEECIPNIAETNRIIIEASNRSITSHKTDCEIE
jgi:hypothetical protein